VGACARGARVAGSVGEGRRRAERLYPVRPWRHGFFGFPAFIGGARDGDRGGAVLLGIHARMAEKVRNRDRGLTIEEKALRMAARERSI